MPQFSAEEAIKAVHGHLTAGHAEVFDDVTTDTRRITKNSLFVALKGEKFDGADFLKDAASGGATGVIVSADCPAEKYTTLHDAAVITVDDTLVAYQRLAHHWREKFDLPIVAVTGSNGKTTTKDLTAAVLSPLGNILKTKANYNNEIGLPLTLLELDETHRAAVVEIGMRGKGQIAALMPVAHPTIGIITNVGTVHMELLGSIENIAAAKGEMAENLTDGGTLVLNADDERVFAMREKAKPHVKVITYGFGDKADVQGEIIDSGANATKFAAMIRDERHEFTIPLIGRHNVSNALAAVAVADSLGLKPAEINDGFSTLTPTKMRFEMSELKGCTVINDAYNASPASMIAAINTMANMPQKRKVAVLGDMLELGDSAEDGHRSVGKRLAEQKFAAVIAYGKLAEYIADEAHKNGVDAKCVATHEDAADEAAKFVAPGTAILFKGSRGMKMELVIDLLRQKVGVTDGV